MRHPNLPVAPPPPNPPNKISAAALSPPPCPNIKKLEGIKWDWRLARWHTANDMAARDRALINTTIVDSGVSGWYFKPGAPVSRVNQAAEKIHVGTAVGHAVESAASCELPLPDIPPDLFGHIMPGF